MHFFALSWDGFQKSSLKTAEIFENFGPRAEFNTAATVSLPNNGLHHNMRPDDCWRAPYGDFVLKCLEIFSNLLAGFEPSETIFAFPYNASTPEPESWLPGVVRAFRTMGDRINALPSAQTVKLTIEGPEEAKAWLDHYLRGLSEYLSRTLGRLVALPDLKILTAQEVLTLAKQHTLFVLYD